MLLTADLARPPAACAVSSNGDGTWTVTKGPAGPDFIRSWLNQPGVHLVTGDVGWSPPALEHRPRGPS